MKRNKLVIDLDVWQTQQDYSKDNLISAQVVSNWIRRGKIETWHIEPLSLTLVKKKVKEEAPAT